MNGEYNYKIINDNPKSKITRRVMFYTLLALFVISIALLILFILFELYLYLCLPAILIVTVSILNILLARFINEIDYSYCDGLFTITKRIGLSVQKTKFFVKDIKMIKNAEKSELLSKTIIDFTFIHNKIIMKNLINHNTSGDFVTYIVELLSGKNLLLLLDKYMLSMLNNYANTKE